MSLTPAPTGQAHVLTDLVGGRLQAAFVAYATAGPHIRSGALPALAVADPAAQARLKGIGGEPASSSPQDHAAPARRLGAAPS